ncbi:Deaminated glutathione amidase [Zhongshania aliphaticivorans]|uniref:Deaminated glutathione amidase n=1 Tax=Zhongshania aliphaticivorans TaxID=1470434 RepID=A0A5S9MQI7_9GAMM|nr:carbon-nitrogen hydrolase family protein [Zhongshania aliphaticivorans]CAA0079315.1 Deaminated glutathione amidase [Zhongshania aliphaticivorans]CAA0086211.1 Deaminated glutathione amidase [Zhongshania aliphaticivorans]
MANTSSGSKNIAASGKVLRVRNAALTDIPAIAALSKRVYTGTGIDPYSRAELRGQLNNFAEGKFVVTLEDDIVGYCATFRVSGDVCLKPHSWAAITANGYGTRHDPDGEWLYGMEVCVDSSVRGYRIGQRLYNARKKLCEELGLKGIVFVGRFPSLSRRIRKYGSAENYLDAVVNQQTRDPVLSFQLRNNFEVIALMPNYLIDDKDSMGYGVHLVWHNPKVETAANAAHTERHGGRQPDTVRVGTVQYMQRRVTSFVEFMSFIEYFVDVVADYKGDFVVFPELITLQLLSIEDQELSPIQSIEALTKYTPRYVEAMQDLAVRYNINIIGGSHPTRVANGRVENISYVFHRDGRVDEQAKIHPTPNEVYWWNIEGGNELQVIDTDCGPIGVLICYDSEFPELGRHLVDQGAEILFVPFCTDERQSYMRVRYSCQARAVENQVYVVMSGNVGNLPNVANMDIQYAQSCILTPCDFHFARDGIAADTTPNVETVAIADLRPESLRVARNSGTVQNLRDRRHDLYQMKWRGN